MMKVCKKCKQSFPATREHFYKALGNKDGLYNICKECHKGNKPVRKTKAPKGYVRPRPDDTVRILTDSEVLSSLLYEREDKDIIITRCGGAIYIPRKDLKAVAKELMDIAEVWGK